MVNEWLLLPTAAEREGSCDILANRIMVMKDRIQRKDELLLGYEKDLSKLRQAETLADSRSNQVQSLAVSILSSASFRLFQ